LDSNGSGQPAILNQNLSPNSPSNPAHVGDIIIIYLTGLGTVEPPLLPGFPGGADPLNRTVAAPTVLVGGIEAEILYSGCAPGFAGLYQINARILPGTMLGNSVPLRVSMAGRTSKAVIISVIPFRV
jgi:uncharacterized protein (TIGR03437 family)